MDHTGLAGLLKLSADIKENTGTTPFLEPKIQKAHDLLHGKCPRCRNGNVSQINDKEGYGRGYFCNLCDWAGWLPFKLIDIADEDTLAYTLVKFFP